MSVFDHMCNYVVSDIKMVINITASNSFYADHQHWYALLLFLFILDGC